MSYLYPQTLIIIYVKKNAMVMEDGSLSYLNKEKLSFNCHVEAKIIAIWQYKYLILLHIKNFKIIKE